MARTVHFVGYGGRPSFQMRGKQVAQSLQTLRPDWSIHVNTPISRIKNSIVIVVKNAGLIPKLKAQGNIVILDVVDSVLNPLFIKLLKRADQLITCHRYPVPTSVPVTVIPHHWDPRLRNAQVAAATGTCEIGYMGDTGSMVPNLQNWNVLVRKHNVRIFDTSCGKDVTPTVKKSGIRIYQLTPNNFKDIKVPFQCHLNIRTAGFAVFRYKPANKVSTAAALGCNIITTRDSSIAFLLPLDYPYFCSSHDLKSVLTIMDLARKTYKTDTWNTGLKMMEKVKQTTSLENITQLYSTLISTL